MSRLSTGGVEVARAIFTRAFNYSSRKTRFGWAVKPGPHTQSFPKELIDAAIAAGVAEVVPPRRKMPISRPVGKAVTRTP